MIALDRLPEIFDLLDYHIAAYDRAWRYTYVNTAAARTLGHPREALHEAQERLQFALDAAQMVAWDHDMATGRTTLSSSAHRVLGTTDGGFLWPAAGGAQGHEPQEQARTRAVDAAQQQGRPWRVEFSFVRPDTGQTIWLEDRGRVKVGPDGVPTGASGVLLNISERVALERQLTGHVRELAEANRLKDEFLATLSHELRTPLNVIRGRVRMLPAIGRPEEVGRVVDIIDRNSAVIERIVGDLLDVARSTRGQLRLECHQVAFAQVAAAALLAVQPAADAKQITLVSDVADGLPLLWADGARLQQVLWNLLNNAVKFTPPHGRVDLAVDADNGGIVVRVSDTGIGIAPELIPRIFDPFWQAEGGTARRFGGLGLGLSIARTLVELHGGHLDAESGGASLGTRFTIRLPLGVGSAVAAPPGGVPGGR